MSPKRLILSGFHIEIDYMPGINFCACYEVRNDLIIFLFSMLIEILSFAYSMKCQFQVSSCGMVYHF